MMALANNNNLSSWAAILAMALLVMAFLSTKECQVSALSHGFIYF